MATRQKSQPTPNIMADPDATYTDGMYGGGKTTTLGDAVVTAKRATPKDRMYLFDTRLYRSLNLYNYNENKAEYFYPHIDYNSFVTDINESVAAIEHKIQEVKASNTPNKQKEEEALEARKKYIEEWNKDHWHEYLAPRSFIHPYALVRLAGLQSKAASQNLDDSSNNFMNLSYDRFDRRRFYEIDGDPVYAQNYSKTPTTTTLIRWGNESERNKTPYSFQDFVFCKWWNKIENNRLITLRRYVAPVTDNIEFSDYQISNGGNEKEAKTTSGGSKVSAQKSTSPWTPLATAVTYFGEGTGNNLSDLLSFSAKYNWEEKKADENPIDVTMHQNDAGSGLVNPEFGVLTSGLGGIAKFMGFLGEVNGKHTMNLEAAHNTPPDPYSNGPYENRILGPINVITNTLRRKRGLEFTQNGLKITFSYVSRPIGGINNKAILLDLMANILVLTYSSGSWFGGMWRFRTENPAVYPWSWGDSMNKLYKGKIFGNDGAVMSLTKEVFGAGKNAISTFIPDLAKFTSNILKGAAEYLLGVLGGGKEHVTEGEKAFSAALESPTSKAVQKVIAAKVMKGSTVPYLQHQRALLTGEPVGDWHLTIGNPLNPIAMIGNLVVRNVEFKWSNELGPDDFPIGFDAIVTLDHGLGRDRDAIESMFNRGFGRIYTLSNSFRSSADGETKVDENTGGVITGAGRTKYEETRNMYFGGGTRFIAKTQSSPLKNTGRIYSGDTNDYYSLKVENGALSYKDNIIASYYVNPWQMGMNM